jgi:site-specific DNA-adenine methylase
VVIITFKHPHKKYKNNRKRVLIPYLGNKEKFSNFIIPYIPEDISTYVEPFGGSMGIFFSLDLDKFKNIKFIYNDINYLNSNLFNNLKNNKDFINIIKSTIVDKSVYDKALEDIKVKYDMITDAINWLIVLTCSAPNKIGIDCSHKETDSRKEGLVLVNFNVMLSRN